jgi:phosphatidylglycerol---prolipoprotein diacylglyceryl transferase
MPDPALAAGLHAVLEWAGMALGFTAWRRGVKDLDGGGSVLQAGRFALLVGLLLGAGLGNKLVFLIERPDVAWQLWQGQAVWPGQSIVGGLLGGLIGVEIAKALTRQTRSSGDAMVLPIALGLVLGRVGCFLAGLQDDTYGLPTTLPWGVDLGDGVPRHPSPLYEMVFVAALAACLHQGREHWAAVPGLQFKLFLLAYLLWRLLGDTLKPVRVPYAWGLSGIQWVCLVALGGYAPVVWRAWRAARRGGSGTLIGGQP